MSMKLRTNTDPDPDVVKLPEWISALDAPQHPAREVEALVKRHYGIDGHLTPLDGERDQNVLVSAGGQRRVLKISAGEDAGAGADYQAALLAHLAETAPDLPLPRNIASKDGHHALLHRFDNGQTCAVRMVTYLEGKPLSAQHRPPNGWAGQVGAFQGRLCSALRGFDHVGATQFMPWNASSEVMLSHEMLAFLEPEFHERTAPHLERLKSASLPALLKTRAQVIHNDIHPGNVLTNEQGRISGVIDFGDAIRAPIIQELAVSATSLIEFSPLKGEGLIADLIEGFCAQYPLHSDELALLYDAILLRSILSAALGRMKDQFVSPAQRPRPATSASERGLDAVLRLQHRAPLDTRSLGGFAHG